MSYDDKAHYLAERFIKNRPDELLKPIVGKLSGRKRPVTLPHKDGYLRTDFTGIRGSLFSEKMKEFCWQLRNDNLHFRQSIRLMVTFGESVY